jgi:ubiquinone/menaquinone biosynthesis C-methylase UbiE
LAPFDAFAEEFDFWINRVNPPNYPSWLGSFLPGRIGRALDAGCGAGTLSFYLANYAQRVIGLDLSPAMISLAARREKEHGAGRVELLLGDLNSLPFPAGTFDFIGSDSALHDTEIDSSLPRLRAMLRPGGRLAVRDLVTTRPRSARSQIWQVLRSLKQVPVYLRRYETRVVIRLLRFELRPAWVRHKCQGANVTPGEFMAVFSRYLPGCRFLDQGWAMAAFWQAPPG